jgi:hypothetical protein
MAKMRRTARISPVRVRRWFIVLKKQSVTRCNFYRLLGRDLDKLGTA